ncbi:MAG: FAD-dependent oxidoreductase [Gammaproteobacteria bacterium]
MTDSAASDQTLLVVGAGVSGMTAALEAAEFGKNVILLETRAWLGGLPRQLTPDLPAHTGPGRFRPDLVLENLEQRAHEAEDGGHLKVLTQVEVLSVEPDSGSYTVKVRQNPRFVNERCTACGACADAVEAEFDDEFNNGFMGSRRKGAYLPHPHAFPRRYMLDPRIIGTEDARRAADACREDAVDPDQQATEFSLRVGAIIWATGAHPYSAKTLTAYGYEHRADVISSDEFEHMAAKTGPTGGRIVRPSDGAAVRDVAFVQCAGSRDLNHLRHCSGTCCTATLRQARRVLDTWSPDDTGAITIYHTDIRISGESETLLSDTRSREGVRFIRSKVSTIDEGTDGRLICRGVNTEGGQGYENAHDLVVLAVGMQPRAPGIELPDGTHPDADGFMHMDEPTRGIFPAGTASEPLDMEQSARNATAAAMRAIEWLAQQHRAR